MSENVDRPHYESDPKILSTLVDIMVFEVYPSAEAPTFTCIAKRRIFFPELKAVTFTPNRFTCHHDFLITVWDFVEDTSVTVHVYQSLLSVRAYIRCPYGFFPCFSR